MRFLLNVEGDEFGLRRRKGSPSANPVFTPLSVLEGRCLYVMCLHVKGRFPVKYVANLILFTQPSAVSVTAAECVDSWARLQFSFLSESLRATLSRRNNRSRAGPKTLIKFRRNGNRQ